MTEETTVNTEATAISPIEIAAEVAPDLGSGQTALHPHDGLFKRIWLLIEKDAESVKAFVEQEEAKL